MIKTHFIDYDQPAFRRNLFQASCGEIVEVGFHSPAPTCPRCRQQLAQEAREIAALEAGKDDHETRTLRSLPKGNGAR